MTLWTARVTWVIMPITAGQLAADALAGWSDAVRVTAFGLLWLAWLMGLVALFAPRPAGLTSLRIIAPAFVVAALVAVSNPRSSALVTTAGVVTVLLAAGFALTRHVARASIDSTSWSNEQRFPLRIPPALLITLIPLAVVVVAAVVVVVPLAYASEAWLLASVVLVVGGVPAALAARSLHSLTRRFLVLVPAGFVVSDRLTLVDPVLFPRERIAGIERVDPRSVSLADAVDSRSGSLLATVVTTFTDPATIVLAPRRGAEPEMVEVGHILVAPCEPGAFLAAARRHRIPSRAKSA